MKKFNNVLDKGWNGLEAFMDKTQWWILGSVILFIVAQVVRFFIQRGGI